MTGITMNMRVTGVEQLKRELRRQSRAFAEEMAQALPVEAHTLMAQTTAAAPRESGELASSAVVSTDIDTAKGKVKAAAAFTDEKAAAVHEGVHGGVQISSTRGFKFFERVFNAFERGFFERLAARLRRLTGGGA